MLEPKAGLDLDAIVIAFKVYDPEDERLLAETVAVTLQQIQENNMMRCF